MNAPSHEEWEALLREMDADVGILVLVQGTLANGEGHYAYVSIPPSRYAAFKEAEARGNYNLAEFGAILEHGPGRTPPPDVQERMREQYGAQLRFEEDLTRLMQQLRFPSS